MRASRPAAAARPAPTSRTASFGAAAGVVELWRVTHAKTADLLVISIHEILHDSSHDLGVDPGLQKDGVEADLQRLLAEQLELLGDGHTLVRREYMTAIGPLMTP